MFFPVNVLHVVAGLPRDGGGLAEAVCGLCRALAGAGCTVTLATAGEALADGVERARAGGVRLHAFAAKPNRFCYSGAMRRGLADLAREADVVHVHSNWTFPVWWASRVAVRLRKPLVRSPHGCLNPARLARSRVAKRLAGRLFERRSLRGAACLHATAATEAAAIRAYGLVNPVAVIPFGVDHEALGGSVGSEALLARFPAWRGRRLLLSLSRLDPIKGLDLLVAAWSRLAPRFPDWHLVVAGPDSGGCAADLAARLRAAGTADRATLCGPLYGADRAAALRACDLFVLPSRDENLALAVAEAAFVGRPVVATHGTPWAELPSHGAGWWVPADAAGIEAALAEALALDAAVLRAMGERGRTWVADAFAWPAIGRQMVEVYGWLREAGARPTCVQTGTLEEDRR
jgi:glycosyltransferase involved in cell wall biosynthesis